MQHLTTPFGRRPLTAAQIDAQAIAAACPPEATADKWAILRNIATARTLFGLADRSVAVLSALASFHPGSTLQIGHEGRLIVFPSNAQLRHRAHGIAETTLRYHLAALVEAGLVIRRDSPNGKRYARKGQGGEIAQAFGFDLAPLVVRAAEFAAAAEVVECDRRMERLARERVSLLRRDLGKLLDWAATCGADGPWEGMIARLQVLVAAIPRRANQAALEAIATDLTRLLAEAHNILDTIAESKKSDGNARENGRQQPDSNSESVRIEKSAEKVREETPEAGTENTRRRSTYPLPMVLEACPDIVGFAQGGVRTWTDLVSAADLTRSMLGISPAAWHDARDAMGPETAAATVAAILQRVDHIRSPGGYLRSLVERKRAGQFSLGPVLQALLRQPDRTARRLENGRSMAARREAEGSGMGLRRT